MEQYRLHHNDKVKPRNKAEHLLIEYSKILLANPVDLTIVQILDNLVDRYCEFPKKFGRVYIGGIKIGSRIAGQKNIYCRYFTISHPSRGTYSLSISETIMKDADKGFSVYERLPHLDKNSILNTEIVLP